MNRPVLSIIVLLALMLGLPKLAAAQEATPTTTSSERDTGLLFAVGPVETWPNGYVELELKPTESASFTARITVQGDEHASLLGFVGNTSNPINGGFAVLDIASERTGVATWITLDHDTFEMDPGSDATITASVTVPENTPPGQYIAGLVVQTAQPIGVNDERGSFGLLPIIRSAMAIQITVPGPVNAGFSIGAPTLELQNGVPLLTAPIANTGNVLVKPAGTATVSDTSGHVLVTAPVTMGSVYMGNTSAVQIVLPNQFAPGDYVISIDLSDQATGVSAKQTEVPITLAPTADDGTVTFSFGVSVKPDGDPVRYADVAVVISNGGDAIPTATVKLHVLHDGAEVEVYPLSTNQAIPAGDSTISQRYIPADDWQTGTYTFAVEIVVVDAQTGAETAIGTVDSSDSMVVP